MAEQNISEKNAYQKELLSNRLSKRYKHLKKWAKRSGILCYRLYDRDIPEIPLAIDIYEEEPADSSFGTESGAVAESLRYGQIALYERPYEKAEEDETEWLQQMAEATSAVLGIPMERIITKTRKRQRGDSQYEKSQGKTIRFITREQGLRFCVNLSDYIDTGLFFDHRPLRLKVQNEAQGKKVLNLYCYTGAFTVYSAAGGASSVDSVDLSSKYLDWARENMRLNGFTDGSRYRYIPGDVTTFLEKETRNRKGQYDIIVLDPPTFSNSKKTENTLDINRDWPALTAACTELLAEGGVLYFSTNSRKLVFDDKKLPEGFTAKDISASTIPEDFRNEHIHRVWQIQKATPRSVLVHGYFPEHP